MDTSEIVLQIKDISKTFPNSKALTKVNLDIRAGEVVALCGENGAGKSTLVKILAAVYSADDGGEIIYKGKKVNYKLPMEAKNDGIVLIFQELSLVKKLNVAENIYLGSLPISKYKTVDWKQLYNNTQKVLDQLGCTFSVKAIVGDLAISQQQMVEIARAIALDANILILDEPTSSLTIKEKEKLFKCIDSLKEKGVGIIYISHKMNEIFEISDRIIVLRDGCISGNVETMKTNIDKVVEMMIGRTIDTYYHKAATNKIGKEVLKVENLSVEGIFNNISFSVKEGEVLGLYGLVGAGRTEIMESIFGIRKISSGKIYINEKPVKIKASMEAVNNKIGLLPENRKEQGLVLGMDCQANIALANLKGVSRKSIIDKKKILNLFNEYKEKLSINTSGLMQLVRTLSGGNQQKIVISKWLATKPKILILDEPTRGIDVGSKAEIHKLIAKFAEEGMAIIIISSEMPEILGISTRLITITEGKITGEFVGDEISERNIISAITKH